MIEKIRIAQVATFGEQPEVLEGLSQFNYLYGPNGSGKTTLSRLIASLPYDPEFADCEVMWRTTPLQVLAYNRDFITRNFNASSEIKGIFTLGEKHDDTLKQISEKNKESHVLEQKIANLGANLQGSDGLGGKVGELSALEEQVKETIWTRKKEHETRFKGPLKGFMGSKDSFKSKMLQERAKNTANVLTLAELEEKTNTLFGSEPKEEQEIKVVDGSTLLLHESNPVLGKRVIGKEDVDIAAMIKKLNNSDWVRGGKTFYDANERVCPFCQQTTSEEFAKSLNEYFDETFVADSKAIDKLLNDYATDTDRLQQELSAIIATPSRYIDVEKLEAEKALLESRVAVNRQRLAQKKKEPSQLVDLESVANILSSIRILLETANQAIDRHNQIVKNLTHERATLIAQVWKYIIEVELKAALADYDAKKATLDSAIKGITTAIATAKNDKQAKEAEVRALEKTTTSIKPTVEAINTLLRSFGFVSFSLAITENGTHYKIVRANGEEAKTTLSEGEKTFITFLYFYHLLQGSDTDSGITTDRVVVFDDPVCSLDSDILYIVSNLIRGVIDEARKGAGQIKQVFVLTHNVYFHKEITFNQKRTNGAMKEETFWVIRKSDLQSKIEKHDTNPIKTSYELLWSEVRTPNRSKLTIQNTLRRILENYFKILGGIKLDDLCSYFEGKDKVICQSLLSWTNDGSHFVNDDLYQTVDDAIVEGYLRVFRAIFDKSKHLEHYKMMMGDDYVEPAAAKGAVA